MRLPYAPLRSALFRLPPETAHHLSLKSLDLLSGLGGGGLIARPPVSDPVQLMGLRFPNRVGLSAGLDKDGDHIRGLAALVSDFWKSVPPPPDRNREIHCRVCFAYRRPAH